MQVFKTYMKITLKKLPVALIYLVVFLVISIIVSNTAGSENEFTDEKLGICVIDEDNSPSSKALCEFIEENHKIVELENDKEIILDAIYYTLVDYVLVIEDGYEEKISSGQTQGLFKNYTRPGTFDNAFFDNTLKKYVGTFSALAVEGTDLTLTASKTSELLADEVDVTIETFEEEYDSSYSEEFSYYFQYLPYIFLAIMISLLVPVILVINSNEIRNRTNCSSIGVSSHIGQIFLGNAVVVVAVWAVFVIAAFVLNDFEISGKVMLAVLNSFVMILVAAGIAIFIAFLAPGKKSVDMIGNTVSLGMSFLCGVFVPQELLGEGVLKVSRFLPAYWYVRANNMLAGTSDEVYSTGKFFSFLGMEMLFAVVMFVLILLVFRLKKNAK